MKVYWIRHGETFQNKAQTYYGALETTLTPDGIKQIEQLQHKLPPVQKIYVSPTARTRQTAKILFPDTTYEEDSQLREREMGIFEGLSVETMHQTYPKEQQAWYQDWVHYQIPEGESAKQQYERVSTFVAQLEVKGEDCIVVAHAGTIRMALVKMLGGPIDAFWKFKVGTGSVVTTCYEEKYWYIDLSPLDT